MRSEVDPGRDATVEALQRKVEEYERWFRGLDAQMRVLERERQKLSAIVNHTGAGFLLVDAALRIVWDNDVFTRRLVAAAHPGAVAGATCCDVLCRRGDAGGPCTATAAFRSGGVAHDEIRMEVDGRPRHIYATAVPIKAPEGSVEQVIVMLQDVSDLEVLRRSEEALKVSEARFRSIFENAASGMAAIGPDGSFLQVNPALCAFLGFDEAGLLGLKVFDVVHPDDVEPTRRAFAEGFSGRPCQVDMERRYVRKDGEVVWARTSASWLPSPDPKPACCVALVQDVTDRKRLEGELRQAEKMSSIGILVSGVAHELNNPLSGVLGYAQLLLQSDFGEKARRGLENIHREAERCKRIVQNLQTFARKHRPSEEYVGINAILESALELRAYQLKVDGIAVEVDLDPDIPHTMADAHQLGQVFLNIIINAHQAMLDQGGRGRLAVRSRRRGPDVVVEIEDSGPGIPEEHLSRIFDPFFTTKEVGKGTGLGLSICYGIVEEHKGRITARNAPGGGAVFSVEIPIRKRRAPADGQGAGRLEPQGVPG